MGIVAVLIWTALTSSAFFYTMKRLGLLRIDPTIEIIGLDIAEMGGLSEDMYEKIRTNHASSMYLKSPAMS